MIEVIVVLVPGSVARYHGTTAFRLKLQPAACLLSFTANLDTFTYVFYVVLFYSVYHGVYQKSEMTSLPQWLAFGVNYL